MFPLDLKTKKPLSAESRQRGAILIYASRGETVLKSTSFFKAEM